MRRISRHLYIWVFVYLGIRVFQDFFISGVSLLMCSYLQDAVRYWQESLGPDLMFLLFRHFFIYAFVDLFYSVQFFAGREVHWRPLVTYWPAFVCLWGRNIQIRQTISKKCKPEKYTNTANNLKEMSTREISKYGIQSQKCKSKQYPNTTNNLKEM